MSKTRSGWKGLCEQQNMCVCGGGEQGGGNMSTQQRKEELKAIAVSKAQLKISIQKAVIEHMSGFLPREFIYKWYFTYSSHSLVRWALLSCFPRKSWRS